MKYSIEGFSQEYATTLRKNIVSGNKEKLIKIDCTDLVILRWFVDFYPNMKKMTVDGQEYAWLSHSKLAEELPLLDISKRACIERMQKLVEFGILKYKLLKEGGTFSLYTFGENYINLIRSNNIPADAQDAEGMRSNNIPAYAQPYNKDYSINNSSTNNSSIRNIDIYNSVIDYLNSKAGTRYTSKNKDTQKHINARLTEGFKVKDFKTVIDKKCKEWSGTEWEKYLRPSTLFGTKFESYLNAPATTKTETHKTNGMVKVNGKQYILKDGKYYIPNGSGIAVDPFAKDDLPF